SSSPCPRVRSSTCWVFEPYRAAHASREPSSQRRILVEEVSTLMQGFAVALTWKNLIFMLVGILLGVLIGVLPGLGGANGVAILLPLTFSIPPKIGRES